MIGWIKIHRKLLEWEWYDEPNTLRLFIHLLLIANRKPAKYRGVNIKKGEVMTGQDLLAKQLKLTRTKIRVALRNLRMTNEITIKSTSKGSIIQIVKWVDYQTVTNEKTTEQPQRNQDVTTNKKYKEIKEDKKLLFDKWIKYRIEIKKPIKSELTIDTLLDKFKKFDINKIELVINSSIENNYQGLFWDKKEKSTPKKETTFETNR